LQLPRRLLPIRGRGIRSGDHRMSATRNKGTISPGVKEIVPSQGNVIALTARASRRPTVPSVSGEASKLVVFPYAVRARQLCRRPPPTLAEILRALKQDSEDR